MTWSSETLILRWWKSVEDTEGLQFLSEANRILQCSASLKLIAPLEDNSCVTTAVEWSVHACALYQICCQLEWLHLFYSLFLP